MERDVSWQGIVIALLVGCAVFAAGKFAYGFRISLTGTIPIVIFVAVVFGLAALILVFRDKVTLKSNVSPEERRVVNARRSDRLQRGWAIAIFSMALIALLVHAFGLVEEPLWQRLLFLGLAAVIVTAFLLNWRNSSDVGLGEGESANEVTEDKE